VTDPDELLRTLLFEGYALYPYTPGATKNATPTPFGILYPPAYAAASPVTFDCARMQGVVVGDLDGATVRAEVVFLEPAGERHEGVERRVELGPVALRALPGAPVVAEFACSAVRGRVALRAEPLPDPGLLRVRLDVHNLTHVAPGLERREALRAALLSTHLVARLEGAARFCSPVAPEEAHAAAVLTSAQVNTFPVLASDDDRVLLGAAIVLPDHPQLAPESRGDLFDATEIEEALRLHLLALSDGERDAVAGQDPAVAQMVERAIASAPTDLAALHGRVTLFGPPREDPEAGEREVRVGEVVFRPGTRVLLHPRGGAQDELLDGRAGIVERVYVDVDRDVHLAVTLDDDPGQELMREMGRYRFFRPGEVEVLP
jgi:hypothetical protein